MIAVSATDSYDVFAAFSSYGSNISLSAPGVEIWTTNRDGTYGAWSGTSFSSPIAAGVAALVLSVNPQLTNASVLDILKNNSDDLGVGGYDTYLRLWPGERVSRSSRGRGSPASRYHTAGDKHRVACGWKHCLRSGHCRC